LKEEPKRPRFSGEGYGHTQRETAPPRREGLQSIKEENTMKTEKHTIQFVSIETPLSTEIIISKKEYLKQLAFLTKQITKTAGEEFPAEQHVIIEENEKIQITRRRFSVGTGDVYLTIYTCKPGYHFK
jgi:hypothetical protein